ncbi:MAG: hypothetical protein EKK37_01650 [Sphingobacteriales bacterium]|nr:MAG: hypothetical protein EKK37_01650 [Sphingobacteriales bacterium]
MKFLTKVILYPSEKSTTPFEINMPWWDTDLLMEQYPFIPEKGYKLEYSLEVNIPELIRMYFEQLLNLSLKEYLLMKKDTPNETFFKETVFSGGKFLKAIIIIEELYLEKNISSLSLTGINQ